jgi:ABC-type sugar transport system ATPase subunit
VVELGVLKYMEKSDSNIILSIENVSKSFPGVKALDSISLKVRRGIVHAIIGENGAGKSTLMKILSGVYKKDSGSMRFDGETVEFDAPIESLRKGISIIYQEFNLVNSMTVGENIFLGRFHEMGGMKKTHAAARKLLEWIGSGIDTYTLVGELSISEKQLVEIAKALSFNSKLIIMDEPSSSLTREEFAKFKEIILQLRKQGVSIIYISHKLDEIFDFCDDVTVMRDGHVIETRPTLEFDRSSMIAAMIGRTMEAEYPERPHAVSEPIMEVRSICTRKLHDISFVLNRGEILGIVGLVGSGRTEIVRAIFGADKAKGHKILVEGKEVTVKNPRDAKRNGMGFVPEDRKQQGLILPFSVGQNITMAILDRLKKLGFVDKSELKAISLKLMKSLDIKAPSIQTKVLNLSGGNQQKCVIGRWLETKPTILIMDEPTRGIDVGAKYGIYLLMKQIVENGGSIILISSELSEVLSMSNRVLTIRDGKITGEFNPETVPPQEIMGRVFG